MRILLLALLSIGFSATAQIREAALRQHIKILANDSLMGRGTGTSGEKMAAAYIESQFKTLKLKPGGENNTFYQSFPYRAGAHGTGREGTARNIIARIDNGAARTIIIGAHYDHLGLGHDGNSLDANAADKIHNGADDNASGVAGVIELARYFRTNPVREKNNFIFICFSGEELGLYGSKYFTEHPTIAAGEINYMINMDMIGRLDPAKGLAISGSGTSPEWEPLLKSLATPTVPIKTDSSGMGPSDHASFYLKNIPVLHFFTGSHSDYHKPSDDADKINYAGEKAVLEVIISVIEKLDNSPKLAFLPTKNKSMGRSTFKVTMGIMPSYTSNDAGVLVDGVSEGKPAQKAGVQTGDIITQLGDFAIKDVQTYMEALGKFEKGQTVPLKVKRKGEEVALSVTF